MLGKVSGYYFLALRLIPGSWFSGNPLCFLFLLSWIPGNRVCQDVRTQAMVRERIVYMFFGVEVYQARAIFYRKIL